MAEPGTDERARIRSTLSIALRGRFEATGQEADLNRSVAEGTAAVADTLVGRPEHTRRAGQLAGTLQARFLHTSGVSDAVAAIDVYAGILDELATNHPDRFGYLVNRGLARLGLWQVRGDDGALASAIDDLRSAVRAPGTAGPADRPAAWSNLCGALRNGWERDHDPALLDEAVEAGRTAVGLLAAERLSRPGHLINLAAALQEQFLRTRSGAALDEAEEVSGEALRRLPTTHPDRAEALTNLGNTLRLRFDATGEARAAAGAVIAYRRAARSTAGVVAARLRGAVGWGRLEMRRQAGRPVPRWARASTAYAAAIDLLALVAWPGLGRADREHLLAAQTGLAADAAAVAVADGRPDVALTRLEAGRAVLLAQALAEHTDPPELVRLRAVAAELGDRVAANRARLRALGAAQVPETPSAHSRG